MAVKTGQSEFAKSMGSGINTAITQHAKDETSYGFQALPGGITNGRATLEDCYFDKVKDGKKYAGKWFFRASGTVTHPKFIQTPEGKVKVQGRTTSQIEMLCDTEDSNGNVTTQAEHIARVMNILRQLGGEDYTAEAKTIGDIEQLAIDLQEMDPPIQFKFSTSEGGGGIDPRTKKERPKRVFENWHGAVTEDDEVTEDATSDVVDGSGEQFDETVGDLDTVVTEAMEKKESPGRKQARNKLKELALSVGITEEAITDAESWEVVGDMIREVKGIEGDSGEEETEEVEEEEQEEASEETEEVEEEEEQEEATPEVEVGAIFNYYQLDKKGNKVKNPTTGKVKKPIQVEVTKVFTEKQLVHLKDSTSGKNILGLDGKKTLQVPWSQLIPIE